MNFQWLQTLEEERGELLIALEELKKQVVDLERELENKTLVSAF